MSPQREGKQGKQGKHEEASQSHSQCRKQERHQFRQPFPFPISIHRHQPFGITLREQLMRMDGGLYEGQEAAMR